MYNTNGQYHLAIPLYERIIETLQTTHVETNEVLLAHQHMLALAYTRNGQQQEAIRLYELVVRIRQTTLSEQGALPAALLESMTNLALEYQNADRYTEAIPLLERIVRGLKQRFPSTNEDVLRQQNALATAYAHIGELQAARDIFAHVVRIKET